MKPRVTDVLIDRGETKTIDVSFTAQATPSAESGLDRLIVRVQHINQGGGPGNEYPALIMEKEAVFCPPRLEKK
jgi:hypothetical protein